MGRTFQVAATFASMTVRENVRLALLAHAGRGRALDHARVDASVADADALLARVGCADLADAHCATLAYGDAKRVELALALAGKPRLLLMDEPTAGMAPRSRARADAGRRRPRAGTTASRCCSPSTTWTWCSASPTA